MLRELNLAGTPITDRGVVQLCISTEGRRQCQRLQKLVVSETCVSVSGAAVVLQSLPSLTDFDFDHIFEVRRARAGRGQGAGRARITANSNGESGKSRAGARGAPGR